MKRKRKREKPAFEERAVVESWSRGKTTLSPPCTLSIARAGEKKLPRSVVQRDDREKRTWTRLWEMTVRQAAGAQAQHSTASTVTTAFGVCL